jgi:beta-glucosidase
MYNKFMIKKEYIEDYKKAAAELVSKMTLTEKVSQLRNKSMALPKLGIKEYEWWNEGIHGVARAGIATVFMQAIGMAATFSEEILEKVADIISTEARAKYNEAQRNNDYGRYKGLTIWAPAINIYRDPRWGRGHETYGEDPYLTARLAVAFVKGLQGEDEKYLKTAACAKALCAYSGPEAERHSFDAKVSVKDLYETYLPQFEAAVKEGNVESIMGAYNRVNGEAACASPTLMEDILRKKWGFDGHFLSDCGAVKDIFHSHKITRNPIKAVALALKAGCDLECGRHYGLLYWAKKLGYVKEEDINRALIRLLTTRYKLGMFDENCPFNNIPIEVNACEAHENYAVEVAEKGIVLLKNDGLLPLKENLGRVFITGFNASNKVAYLGNYNGEPTSFIMVPEGVALYNKDSVFLEGVHLYRKDKDETAKNKALEEASKADVILVCTGLDSSVEGEDGDADANFLEGASGDRGTLELPKVQKDYLNDLIKTGKKIVILNFSGGSINLSDYENSESVSAILQCWYAGARGGLAIANVLFGKANPSGKLPVTFYESGADLPPLEDYSMENRTYRYYKGKVVYPFGHGLSYTKFKYENARVYNSIASGDLKLELDLTNVGDLSGEEVVQVYLSYPKKDYALPIRSLIKFKRVSLDRGEKVKLSFNLTPNDFETINPNGERVLLEGEYTLSVGGIEIKAV